MRRIAEMGLASALRPRFWALALPLLAAALACKLHFDGVESPFVLDAGERQWVVDDGQRKIAYRLSGRPHPRFELKAHNIPACIGRIPRIVCRNCAPGAPLGQGGTVLLVTAGAADEQWRFLWTPDSFRRSEPWGRAVRPMTDPAQIALDPLKGWTAPFEYTGEAPPEGWKPGSVFGYLSDGCASIVILPLSDPPALFSWISRRVADDIMAQLADMLQSVRVTRLDP